MRGRTCCMHLRRWVTAGTVVTDWEVVKSLPGTQTIPKMFLEAARRQEQYRVVEVYTASWSTNRAISA